jgi:hypothetical protein
MPQAGRLQLVLLAGQRADAIRAFIKADGFVIHVEFLWMKKGMVGLGVPGKFAVMTESASWHTCPKGQV